MASVNLRGVKKAYAGMQVVHGIDCAIGDGEFIVILGPSGCGKSTLLRMVAGLETVTDGDIEVDGKVVNNVEPKDRNIAMVFQNYALYPHMSVYDNMAYGLRVRRMSREEIDERVRRVAGILDLAALLERKPRQLSGGQRQRVAMGRAIVRQPLVFLFDEPLSNLDAKLRVQMRLEIKRLHAEIRTTSIYVTHDQVEAMTLADRLIVMNAGRAEQIGTPLEVYHEPASVFVAGFIGSPAMNMIPVRTDGAGGVLELPGGGRLDFGPRLAGRGEVTLGLRPEHLEVVRPEQALFDLGVELVEALGADTLVHGRVGGSGPVLTVRLPGAARVAAGEMLPLAVGPENIHVFETTTGNRL